MLGSNRWRRGICVLQGFNSKRIRPEAPHILYVPARCRQKNEIKNDTIRNYYGIKHKYILNAFWIEKITEDTPILRRGDVTFVYVKSKDQKTEAHYATNNNIKVRIQRHGTERQLVSLPHAGLEDIPTGTYLIHKNIPSSTFSLGLFIAPDLNIVKKRLRLGPITKNV